MNVPNLLVTLPLVIVQWCVWICGRHHITIVIILFSQTIAICTLDATATHLFSY